MNSFVKDKNINLKLLIVSIFQIGNQMEFENKMIIVCGVMKENKLTLQELIECLIKMEENIDITVNKLLYVIMFYKLNLL
jgi:hypothetical protein